MHAIAYVSTASDDFTHGDLAGIVGDYRRNNEALGITGVLLHCDGNFMQYIEGPEEAVRATYERLLGCELHHQVNEILNQPIERREFAEWTLGFSEASHVDFLELATASWTGATTLGPGGQMLQMFWRNCRCAAA